MEIVVYFGGRIVLDRKTAMYALTSDEDVRALNENIVGCGCIMYGGVPHAYLVIDQSFFGDDRMGSNQPVGVSSSVKESWREIVATSIVAQDYLVSQTLDFHQQAVELELKLVADRFDEQEVVRYIHWRIHVIEVALERLRDWKIEPVIKSSWLKSLTMLQAAIGERQ